MRELISAGVVIYRVNNNLIEYLLLHHIVGHWDFAKGKIEAGETKEEAALRELFEETGLHTELDPEFIHSIAYNFVDRGGGSIRKTVYFFLGRVNNEQQVMLSHEHKDFVWLPYDKAYSKMTFDTARQVLEKADESIKLHGLRE